MLTYLVNAFFMLVDLLAQVQKINLHAVAFKHLAGKRLSHHLRLGAGMGSVHERAQALRFLQICLASALNLRSPADSALPGTAADKLAAMLFGGQACTCLCA